MDRFQYKRILAENLEILRNILNLNDNFLFEHDNDPKHTSQYVEDFFENNGIDVMGWSSQSSDLNPIEHLWEYIKKKVQNLNYKNLKKLKEIVKREWENILIDVCKKLVDSMPR